MSEERLINRLETIAVAILSVSDQLKELNQYTKASAIQLEYIKGNLQGINTNTDRYDP